METFNLRVGRTAPNEGFYIATPTAEGIPNLHAQCSQLLSRGQQLELTFSSDANKTYRIAVSQASKRGAHPALPWSGAVIIGRSGRVPMSLRDKLNSSAHRGLKPTAAVRDC